MQNQTIFSQLYIHISIFLEKCGGDCTHTETTVCPVYPNKPLLGLAERLNT